MYFKITNEAENHHGLQYHDGLVEDNLPFKREGSCVPGGIYFADLEYIPYYFEYGVYIREVTIPPDAEFVKDPSGSKYRSSKVILGPRKHLKDISTWKYLIGLGLEIDFYNDFLLCFAISQGYFDLFTFLFDIRKLAEYSNLLKAAIYYQQLDIVRFLINIKKHNKVEKYIFISAIDTGNLDIIKLLLEKDPNIEISYIHLQRACCNGTPDMVKYFVKFFKFVDYDKLIETISFYGKSEMLKCLTELQEDSKIMENI
jgi:hypothetical protein